jgi:hypothetical protein
MWQCINHGRRIPNYFTRNEKNTLKYFPRNMIKAECKRLEQNRHLIYCNRFDQSTARQRLSKHFPTCNNTGETVFSMWSAPSNNRNWVLCD